MSYYANSNEAGKLLANHVRGHRHKTKIPYVLDSTTQEKLHQPQAIADAFSWCYISLYNLQEDPHTHIGITINSLPNNIFPGPEDFTSKHLNLH